MNTVFERILPSRFDNAFPGRRLALWVFYALTALTLWRSSVHLIRHDGGSQSIAGMPLDSYPPGAAANVIATFGQWGLSQLLLGLLFLLAATRYRSMVPLMWLVVVAEYLGRFFVGTFKPIDTMHTAPGQLVNLPFAAVALVMLAVSVWAPRNPTKGMR